MDKSGSYFTISGMAKALDVQKSHIRFCEANGLIAPKTIPFKRRVYSRYDLERLKLVFRFVIMGYSTEQIIEMIGTPDGDLDEKDRLVQGIAYGEAKIEALETHKDSLSFTKRARIANEIEMLREHVKTVRAIKTGGDEKKSEKTGIKFQEDAENVHKPKQHPIKVISVFIAGLVLVILIGSYFYYRTGKEEMKTVKQVQKKAVPKEQIQMHRASEPVNLKESPEAVAPKIQKNPESLSAGQPGNFKTKSTESPPESIQTVILEPVTDDGSEFSKEPSSAGPEVEAAPKTDVKKENVFNELKENPAPSAAGRGALPVTGSDPVKEKADNFQQR
jgi:DNA-binding transcriptional MerR regulator